VKQSLPAESTMTRDARERLKMFVALLERWNARINLVGPADAAEIWQRHVLDSAQLGPLLPPGSDPFIDLGSGAGFPGLVLAVLTDRPAHLVESDQRKAAFLHEAVRLVGVVATVHGTRAEFLQTPPARLITARALAPLPRLLSLAVPLLAQNGVCIFPKGSTTAAELTAAQQEWHMHLERFPSRTDPNGTILRLREIRRAPSHR
jgi:16S rRNA (guanine(527)-N(7))-methyltransferase RsmG